METSGADCTDLELADSALEGDEGAAGKIGALILAPGLRALLVKRGATVDEAEEVCSELASGCFGESDRKGELRNLLVKYSGKAPLQAYLGRVALNRWISKKRKRRPGQVSLETGGVDGGEYQVAGVESVETEDEIVQLLRTAVMGALARVDQESLAMLRLIRSYRLPQKRVGEMWGWHESKVSRTMAGLISGLREEILAELHREDAWLQVEWEDFLGLCGESLDLFDSIE